jgi:uncharacterized protein (DUF1778 family)
MAKKKATAPAKRKWRPSAYNPDFTELGLRVLIHQADLIQQAAEAQAARLSIQVSRNNFCARAVIDAAEKELGRTK